jgi:hypothetical protein
MKITKKNDYYFLISILVLMINLMINQIKEDKRIYLEKILYMYMNDNTYIFYNVNDCLYYSKTEINIITTGIKLIVNNLGISIVPDN